MRRLHEQVRFLPCSPRCWNWLRYGVQPAGVTAGMTPGLCPGKAHVFENLGLGGRRVLVSRKWTGKTLKEHKADRSAVVRQVLREAGFNAAEVDRMAADVERPDGLPRYSWRIWDPLDSTAPVYRQVMTRSIAEKLRWKAQYEAAKAATASGHPSATGPPAAGPGAGHSTPSAPITSHPADDGAAVQGERSESRSDTKCP
jgi:hypothetical protein